MPARLRPTAPIATDAILVGDPGRALLLAGELLEQPKMSNHARGLWGYSGEARGGGALTIQSTGMGGPSAAMVLADLAEIGVRRAVRVGTCAGLSAAAPLGALLVVEAAVAGTGAFELEPGEAVAPDAGLLAGLRRELVGEAEGARVASLDAMPAAAGAIPDGAGAVDMQTVALLARGEQLGVAVAALLIVSEAAAGERLADEPLEGAAKRAGRAAAAVLST